MAPALCDVRRLLRLVLSSLVAFPTLISGPPSMAQNPQARKVGNVTFTPPSGWKVGEPADGLTKVVSPEGNAMIVVMAGGKFPGDLRDGFKLTWDSLRQGLGIEQVVSGGEPETKQTYASFESVGTIGTAKDARGNELVFGYVLLRQGGAVCGLAYLAAEQKWFDTHKRAYDAVASSLRLADSAETPADAATSQAPNAPPAMLPQLRPLAPSSRHVRGQVVDMQGQPLSRTDIYVRGTTLAGLNRSFQTSAENGRYDLEVPDGLYGVYASAVVSYNGLTYRLPLHPTDGKGWRSIENSKNGIVKDFVWKLTGLRAEEAEQNYGGTILLDESPGASNPLRRGALLEITLTPDGPLVDGNPGVTLTFQRTWGQGYPTLVDIPIGRYTATARVVGQSARPLRLTARPVFNAPFASPAPSAVFHFQPNDHGSDGVQQMRLQLGQ